MLDVVIVTTAVRFMWTNGLDFTPASDSSSTPDASNETKVLDTYFSAANTTKPLAEYIADGLDADLDAARVTLPSSFTNFTAPIIIKCKNIAVRPQKPAKGDSGLEGL